MYYLFKTRSLFYSLFLSIVLVTISMCAEQVCPPQKDKTIANGNHRQSSMQKKKRSGSQPDIRNSQIIKNLSETQIGNNSDSSEDSKQEAKVNAIEETYKAEIEKRDSKLDGKNLELRKKNQQIEDLNNELSTLQEEVLVKQKENNVLKEELKKKNDTEEKLNEKVESLEKELEGRSTLNLPLPNRDDSQIDQEQKDQVQSLDELQELKQENNKLKKDYDQLLNKIDQNNTEINRLKKQAKELKNKKSELSQKVQELEDENQHLLTCNQELTSELEGANEQLRDNQEYTKRVIDTHLIQNEESHARFFSYGRRGSMPCNVSATSLDIDIQTGKKIDSSYEDDLETEKKYTSNSTSLLSESRNSRPSVPVTPISRTNSLPPEDNTFDYEEVQTNEQKTQNSSLSVSVPVIPPTDSLKEVQSLRAEVNSQKTTIDSLNKQNEQALENISDLQAQNQALDTTNKELTKSYNKLKITFIATTFFCFIGIVCLRSSNKKGKGQVISPIQKKQQKYKKQLSSHNKSHKRISLEILLEKGKH